MGLVWNPLAIAGGLVLVLAWPAAWVIFSAHPGRAQNRALAAFLFLSGLSGAMLFGIRLLWDGLDGARVVYAMGGINFSAWAMSILAYFAFVATVRSPVTRWLKRPRFWYAMVPLLAAIITSPFYAREIWYRGLLPWRHSPGWQYDVGWWVLSVWPWIIIAIDLLGIVAALTALRSARSHALRRKLRWFAAAFVTYDVLSITFQGMLRFSINEHTTGPFWEHFYFFLAVLPTIAAVILLTYGILVAQLFDVDIKLKIGISRTTVAGVFAAIVFVVSEGFEAWLGVDGFVPAIITAAIITLGLRPLRWLGNRVADRLLPHVHDTEAYRTQRQADVYRAALEEMLSDGQISAKERRMLDGLRTNLGILPAQAEAMERDVRG